MPRAIVPYRNRYRNYLATLAAAGFAYREAHYIITQTLAAGRSVAAFVRRASQVGSVANRQAQRLAEQVRYQTGPIRDNLERKGLYLEVDNPMITNSSSAATAATGYAASDVPSDRQYVAVVRHSKERFGKRKRFTLRKVRHNLQANKFEVRSKFQQFHSNTGFQLGLGGVSCAYREPIANSNVGLLPFHLFDITSYPYSVYTSNTGNFNAMPVRQYTLGFTPTSVANREYNRFGWYPRFVGTNTNGGQQSSLLTNENFAVVTNTNGYERNLTLGPEGLRYPTTAGFTHDWSDIQCVFYPSDVMPCKWHIALVSFPSDLSQLSTAGPPLNYTHIVSGAPNTKARQQVYQNDESMSGDRTVNNEQQDELDLRWLKFWSGKLYNPINKDSAALNPDNPVDDRLPFKIIKHTSFLQPARDNVAFNGQAQRHIHKLFYERDWSFKPSQSQVASKQDSTMANIAIGQTQDNAPGYTPQSSPFPDPQAIVYLAVWCENYKVATSGLTPDENVTTGVKVVAQPQVTTSPGFDVVVKMKHTLNATNNGLYQGIIQP